MAHEVDARAEIVHLAAAVVVRPRTPSGSAKVEAEHRAADPPECLRGLKHDLGVHRAAILRMWVRQDDRGSQAVGDAPLDKSFGVHAAHRRRLVEQGFESAGRTGNLTYTHQATSCRRDSASFRNRSIAAA